MSVTVLKLGGSLLDLGDLPDRLRAVFAKLDGDRPLLICGGGEAADVVRRWHDAHRLDEEQSHWLAMESVRLNQRLLLTLMPELELVSNRAAAESAWMHGRVPLLDLVSFVSIEEAAFDAGVKPLPHNWSVTSDSLSAWVAIRWPANRLVLLKSIDLPPLESLSQAAEAELVDEFFPTLESVLPPTFWCRLRGDSELEFRPLKPVIVLSQ